MTPTRNLTARTALACACALDVPLGASTDQVLTALGVKAPNAHLSIPAILDGNCADATDTTTAWYTRAAAVLLTPPGSPGKHKALMAFLVADAARPEDMRSFAAPKSANGASQLTLLSA